MRAQSNPSKSGGVRLEAAFKPRGADHVYTPEASICFEILAIISICVVSLFVAAFREAGHPLWAIPAMTLFLLSGMMFSRG